MSSPSRALPVDKASSINIRAWLVVQLARLLAPDMFKSPAGLEKAIAQDRAQGAQMPPKALQKQLDISEESCCGMRVLRVARHEGKISAMRCLYLHGGAYVLNLQQIQWNLVSRLLERTGGEIYIPIFPLAPEAGWDESLAAVKCLYLHLVSQFGTQSLCVIGDSSGGGLTLLLAQSIRDAQEAAPAALVLFSPWLDLSLEGEDQPALQSRDPVLSLEIARRAAGMWAKGLALNDSRVSPLFGNHTGLPPTLVFSGTREILDSDAIRLAHANPEVIHHHYPEMLHVWPVGPLREGRKALDEAAAFLRQHLVL